MPTQGKRFWVVVALGLILSFFWAETAEAKGIFIYNSGEDVFATGPIPAPFDAEPDLQGFQAGYKCSIIGLFWAYFYTWDCKAVAFREDSANSFTYIDDPDLSAAIAAQYPESAMQMGFWTKHGRWILLLVIVGLIAFRIFAARGSTA